VDGQRVVSVREQGRGIPPEYQDRLVDRFDRSSETGNAKGLGLGLYVTRRIVEAHGGTISVESEVGEGSEFTVRLPLARRGARTPVG